MRKLKEFFFNLSPTNLTVILFLQFINLISIIYYPRIPNWEIIILTNIAISIFVIYISEEVNKNGSNIYLFTNYFYLLILIMVIFKELFFIVDPIQGVIYDRYLIIADQAMFGGNPADFLYKFSNKILTELLQLAYVSYYFLPIILGYELYKKKETLKLEYLMFLVIFGFFLSYLGYLSFPAVGPRFTIYNFANLDKELPGLFLTHFLRDYINSGEGISPHTLHPIMIVERDAFPSGHTDITLLVIYLSVIFKASTKKFILPTGILIIFATVYLRYHYVSDLIAGTLFMIFTVWSGKYLFNAWQIKRKEEIIKLGNDAD
jgi:membrane-associated phospholipid phosphatase